MRTSTEINEQMQIATDNEHNSKYPGMTYEQGVMAAIRWMNMETEDLPMEED